MSDQFTQQAGAGCYRHPNLPTHIVCTRCARPICPSCMVDAAVGFQCPDCARTGARETRQGQLPFGGYPSRSPRTTTIVLIAVNIVVWLALVLTGSYASPLADTLQLTPRGVCMSEGGTRYFPEADAARCALIPHGYWVPGVADGAVWQVITNAFTHIDALHLALNMVGLLFLAPATERVLGRLRFLTIYLVSTLTASAMVMWFSAPTDSTLGASGALFGVMGAVLLLSRRLGGNATMVMVMVAANLVYTFTASGISWQGHLGGLLGGLVTTWLIIMGNRSTRERWTWPAVAAVALLALAAITVRALML
ncbi:MAG: rhomboid family intramembrane serine protease [Actinomycetia bacterium]|nr:rhomboid family intramembrane serine protease [Actinomycetes bacterium]